MPAGVGVLHGANYFLPLRQSANKTGPAIWSINLAAGKQEKDRVHVPHADALGNLALHRGMLISQSVTHIAAFPLKMER